MIAVFAFVWFLGWVIAKLFEFVAILLAIVAQVIGVRAAVATVVGLAVFGEVLHRLGV